MKAKIYFFVLIVSALVFYTKHSFFCDSIFIDNVEALTQEENTRIKLVLDRNDEYHVHKFLSPDTINPETQQMTYKEKADYIVHIVTCDVCPGPLQCIDGRDNHYNLSAPYACPLQR